MDGVGAVVGVGGAGDAALKAAAAESSKCGLRVHSHGGMGVLHAWRRHETPSLAECKADMRKRDGR